MTDVFVRSATEVAALLRTGRLSARELAELVLARVDAVNPAVNAVVETRREAALRAATEAEARGERAAPLRGVPMTIKESFQVAGMHSTWGNKDFAGFVADRDAVVVERLVSAGAVLFGTTNVAPMLADVGQCANALYGRTVNPWDGTRTPGGSTGGGAAAVAAGLTFLEYGSDLAGSIRILASFCGVYGLKPTAGPPSPATRPTTHPSPPQVRLTGTVLWSSFSCSCRSSWTTGTGAANHCHRAFAACPTAWSRSLTAGVRNAANH